MSVRQEGVEKVDHLLDVALVKEVQVIDDKGRFPLKTNPLDHGFNVVQSQRRLRKPCGHHPLSVAEFVGGRPTYGHVALLSRPCTHEGGFSNARKAPHDGVPVLVQEAVKRSEFVVPADDGKTAGGRLPEHRLRLIGRMVCKPLATFFRDVVDLPTTGTSPENMRHANDDHLLIQQCIERQIQTRPDHAHGLRETGQRDRTWNIPRFSKCFGKGPKEAQQLFLRAAQHGKVVPRS